MQYHQTYHIRNVPVYVRNLQSGDVAIWHPFNESARIVVEGICRNHGHWDGRYNNWIVFANYKHRVMEAFDSAGERTF